MSELKVNTIKPAAGSQVTVTAQVLGVPGTEPNHLATVSQLGGGGSSGISRAQAEDLVDAGVSVARNYTDQQEQLQNAQIASNISTAKAESINESKTYTDNSVFGLANRFNTNKFFLPPVPLSPSGYGLPGWQNPANIIGVDENGEPIGSNLDANRCGYTQTLEFTPRFNNGRSRMWLNFSGMMIITALFPRCATCTLHQPYCFIQRSFNRGDTWETISLSQKTYWHYAYGKFPIQPSGGFLYENRNNIPYPRAPEWINNDHLTVDFPFSQLHISGFDDTYQAQVNAAESVSYRGIFQLQDFDDAQSPLGFRYLNSPQWLTLTVDEIV